MTPGDRVTARRQIDQRLTALPNVDALARPSRGWKVLDVLDGVVVPERGIEPRTY